MTMALAPNIICVQDEGEARVAFGHGGLLHLPSLRLLSRYEEEMVCFIKQSLWG